MINSESISPEILGDYLIIDIRTPREWAETGIIKGSILLPLTLENGDIDPNFLAKFKTLAEENLSQNSGKNSENLGENLSENSGEKSVNLGKNQAVNLSENLSEKAVNLGENLSENQAINLSTKKRSNKEIAIVCATGQRSAFATNLVKSRLGIEATNLKGGFYALLSQGYEPTRITNGG